MKHETLSSKREKAGNPLDLRSWLRDIEALGELMEVRGADWNLELGAISELNVKKQKPPALLFDEITGRSNTGLLGAIFTTGLLAELINHSSRPLA